MRNPSYPQDLRTGLLVATLLLAGPLAASQAWAQAGGGAEPPSSWTGRQLVSHHRTWDEMVEARLVRVLVTFNHTNFFIDGGTQRGIVADALRELEKALNDELNLGRRPLRFIAIPVRRDQLIPSLQEGYGDLAAANLTITEERARYVDFALPGYPNASELVVTGPQSPTIGSVDDLAGQRVHVRESSSYRESLEMLNAQFADRGLAPVEIVHANEYLETEDLLAMVNAGLIPTTIADDYLASFWDQIFDDLVVHQDVAIATERAIAMAIRKTATGLKERIDPWIKENRKGSLLGNMLLKRYLKNTKYVDNAFSSEGRQRYAQAAGFFEKYANDYDFEVLMMVAQGYQESGLDQDKRSSAGAIGIMQLLQSTAEDRAVGIPEIDQLEHNIHAGIKYMRHLVNTYFNDPALDDVNRTLFAFAGYNAGPNRIKRLRAKAKEMGYDPNQWFNNVEIVVAGEVGREPVTYVSNIFKYYMAYRQMQEQGELRREAREQPGGSF